VVEKTCIKPSPVGAEDMSGRRGKSRTEGKKKVYHGGGGARTGGVARLESAQGEKEGRAPNDPGTRKKGPGKIKRGKQWKGACVTKKEGSRLERFYLRGKKGPSSKRSKQEHPADHTKYLGGNWGWSRLGPHQEKANQPERKDEGKTVETKNNNRLQRGGGEGQVELLEGSLRGIKKPGV